MENYEKKYKEALERARQFSEKPYLEDSKGIVDYIFPELSESEGEGIRKALLEMVHDTTGDSLWVDYNVHKEDAIAWLEKQGEQKPTIIIPKFRVGDEIKTSNEESLTITKIDEKGYWSEDLFICDFNEECLWNLAEQKLAWSEEDEAKLKSILFHIEDVENKDVINWFKSLKHRYTWKPSDEQMDVLLSEVTAWTKGCPKQIVLESLYNDLKKLKS